MTKERKEYLLCGLNQLCDDAFNENAIGEGVSSYADTACLAAIAIALVEQVQTDSKIKLEFKNCSHDEEKRIRKAVENILADSISRSAETFKRIDQDMPIREI